ncbi:hypothetical protein [Agromyces bauzanensis]
MTSEIIRRLDQLDIHMQRYERYQAITAKPNSELAEDDRRTAWLQSSHVIQLALNMAADNLLALREMIMPEPGHLVLRQTAQYPILRSALEAASLALWLLQPEVRRTRIVRLLQARVDDTVFAKQLASEAASGFGTESREERSMAERIRREAARTHSKHMAQIRAIGEREEIVPIEYENGLPGYGAIIREATHSIEVRGAYASTVWRLISGFTHPSALRSVNYGKRELVHENPDGTDHVLLSANPQHVLTALLAATVNFAAANELLARRLITPASE